MKTKLVILLFSILLISTKNYAQITFSVSPGLSFNSASVGYKVNSKVIPFFGFQYLNAGFKYEETGEEFNYTLDKIAPYTEETKFNGNLYLPNLGVKYFLMQKNKIQTYTSICVTKPFISGKLDDNGTIDDEIKKIVEDVSMIGGECGFGAEYFVDENFSIGGEFGVRYLHFKYSDSHDRDVYNENTGNYKTVTITDTYKFNASPTFSKMALNFYF